MAFARAVAGRDGDLRAVEWLASGRLIQDESWMPGMAGEPMAGMFPESLRVFSNTDGERPKQWLKTNHVLMRTS